MIVLETRLAFYIQGVTSVDRRGKSNPEVYLVFLMEVFTVTMFTNQGSFKLASREVKSKSWFSLILVRAK
jgi:hypothetical protein